MSPRKRRCTPSWRCGAASIHVDDVATIMIAVSDKVLSHHADRAPRDVATAQYSLPFTWRWLCFATPAIRRPFSTGRTRTQRSWNWPSALSSAYAKDGPNNNDMACRLHIALKDGRTLSMAKTDFEGTTTSPLSRERLEQKFLKLSGVFPRRSGRRCWRG